MSRRTPSGGALAVAAGILASRLVGLLRNRVLAHVLGTGEGMAIYVAATRIPNMLQNLLGEGVLSASLIPVYAALRAEKKDAEADQVAGAVFGLLSVLVAVLVLAGVLGAPVLVAVLVPGFEGPARALTVEVVRVLFPATGVLVLSAWCLGILNSHRRFFLPYLAPVAWNLGIIAAVVLGPAEGEVDILWLAVVGNVVGSVAQLVVQLPATLRLIGRFDPRPSLSLPSVRQVVRSFPAAFGARAVVQVSALVDLAFASLLTARAVSALGYAQQLALLPVSLFGMAISAAELPAMSEDAARAGGEAGAALHRRLSAGLDRLALFVVPSAVGFLTLGDAVSGVLLESGSFTAEDSRLVWYILIGSAIALWPQTSGRLYASALFAMKDTATPLRMAAVRVGLTVVVGAFAVLELPGLLGLPAELGVVFITATTGLFAWLEAGLLRAAVARRLGVTSRPRALGRCAAAAGVAGLSAVAVKVALTSSAGAKAMAGIWGASVLPPPELPVLPVSAGLITLFAAIYAAGVVVLRVDGALALLGRLGARRGGGSGDR